MPIDYSKWDALELSDDSDVEVHPNVDKRSFIRAKQSQIHMERAQRRHQITTLKYERIINDGLMERIDNLLTALKSHRDNASSETADQFVFQSMMESAGDPSQDRPPPPPEGVHTQIKEKPTWSQMLAALVDEVKKEVDEKKPENRYEGFITQVQEHRDRVAGLQKQLLAKLDELEKEDKKHITSDDIHTGFDYSNVKKGSDAPSSAKPAQKTEAVELLNPGRPDMSRADTGQSSGADADIEDDDPDNIKASPDAKQFAKIKMDDYRASLQFISEHPNILKEKETDGLLVEAFDAELEGKHQYAHQCVHQALLIQYCRQLGKDGVQLFFKRITTKDHQARKLFRDDVDSTYRRINTRAAEIIEERKNNPEGEGVEQIQLHAVDPNTTINIRVPQPVDESKPETLSEDNKIARSIFESFPPGLQRALESGKLDEVNKVLAKMSVDEAEQVVEQLGNGGMLSLEEGVIDATTEEGQAKVKEIEQTGRMPGQLVDESELAADPE
ncbi:Cdc37 [Macrophomina phaseolina MS6]|uniref:Hsp90 chaperone protein kinase-targeting subunit n=2 Tax=Macrophomina phaseolina TaxID=35725 RepID=K2RKM8_MACPH|nr:Cdc37 [Macrophomina phaseolina MS6]KAH7044015.1 Hsp90 co-chaperone Cdc37 [Macrophomina phaseolina]